MVGILAILVFSVNLVVAGHPFLIGPNIPRFSHSRIVQILQNADIVLAASVDVIFGGFALVARGVDVVHGGVGAVEDLVHHSPLLEAFVGTEVEKAGSAELVPDLVAEVSSVVEELVVVVGQLSDS